jgi:hypothetical protein
VEYVFARSQGNSFFTEELLAAVQAGSDELDMDGGSKGLHRASTSRSTSGRCVTGRRRGVLGFSPSSPWRCVGEAGSLVAVWSLPARGRPPEAAARRADPGRRLTAALPPVLMMLAFEIDVRIVRWVMHALGKPLSPIAPPPTDGVLAGTLPGAVWRSDGLDWNVPPHRLPGPWPPGTPGANSAGHHLPGKLTEQPNRSHRWRGS